MSQVDDVRIDVGGIDLLVSRLRAMPNKLRRRAILNAMRKAMRMTVREAARKAAPVLSAENALRAPHRTPGLLRRSIAVRTSKLARRTGDIGVFVNVKPAKPHHRGAKSKLDPFYWRWQKGRFLQAGGGSLRAALRVFEAEIGPQIQRLDTNPNDPL